MIELWFQPDDTRCDISYAEVEIFSRDNDDGAIIGRSFINSPSDLGNLINLERLSSVHVVYLIQASQGGPVSNAFITSPFAILCIYFKRVCVQQTRGM